MKFGRKLEDKLLAHKIELKPFIINVDQKDIHRNRDLPAAFIAFMGVVDSTLPLKGTAHRVVRGAPEGEVATNVFLTFYQRGLGSVRSNCFFVVNWYPHITDIFNVGDHIVFRPFGSSL